MTTAFAQPQNRAKTIPPPALRTSYNALKSHAKLWSTASEISELLNLPIAIQRQTDQVVFQHVHFKSGQRIHSLNQEFVNIYLVNSGFIKSIFLDEFGNEQVCHFQMKGDLLGIDGMHTGRHMSEAVALSDCDVIVIPLLKLKVCSCTFEHFERAILNIFSRQLVAQQNRLNILASKNAEARVSIFLQSLAQRFHLLGYSQTSFNLRMTRHEMGSYLGLTLETVSRTLSLLNDAGIISVQLRRIVILDAEGLKELTLTHRDIQRCMVKV